MINFLNKKQSNADWHLDHIELNLVDVDTLKPVWDAPLSFEFKTWIKAGKIHEVGAPETSRINYKIRVKTRDEFNAGTGKFSNLTKILSEIILR